MPDTGLNLGAAVLKVLRAVCEWQSVHPGSAVPHEFDEAPVGLTGLNLGAAVLKVLRAVCE